MSKYKTILICAGQVAMTIHYILQYNPAAKEWGWTEESLWEQMKSCINANRDRGISWTGTAGFCLSFSEVDEETLQIECLVDLAVGKALEYTAIKEFK